MHFPALLPTALLAAGAALTNAAAIPDTIAADGVTWNVFADYSRCSRADALKVAIRPVATGDDLTPTTLTTGERVFRLTAPFNGTLELTEPDRSGPYRPQGVQIDLLAAADASGIRGRATFLPGMRVRGLDEITWARTSDAQKKLNPDLSTEGSDAVRGTQEELATERAPDDLFVTWCTDDA